MKDIHVMIDEIVEIIKNQEEYKQLKETEKLMEKDEEVLKLAQLFSNAESEYNACLNHYSFDSDEAKKYQKKLFDAKSQLDNHPLVRKYTIYLQKVNEPLRYLEFNLLNKFKK